MEIRDRLKQISETYEKQLEEIYQFLDDHDQFSVALSKRHDRFADDLDHLEHQIEKGDVNYPPLVDIPGQGHLMIGIKEGEFQEFIKRMNFKIKTVRKYPELINRMVHIYLVALFEAFLSDLIGCLFKDSEVFNRVRQMPIVRQLLYLRTKFDLRISESTMRELTEITETRHVLVHRKGVVDEKYVERVVDPIFSIGDERIVTSEYLFRVYGRLIDTIDLVQHELMERLYPTE